VEKELKRQQKAARELKKSEMTPMKTRDKPLKIKDVFVTISMLIDEFNKRGTVLARLKKIKCEVLIQ
jgi:hypothetical protein